MVCLILGLLLLAGCTSLVGDQWAAKVNGQTITVSELNSRVEKAKQAYIDQSGEDFTTEQGKKDLATLKTQILKTMVESQLISQEVQKLGLATDDAKVKAEMDNLKTQIGDEKKFNDTLAAQGITQDELLGSIALYLNVTKDVNVSDSDVTAYYAANKDKYAQEEQVKAKHILVASEDEAKAIIAQLKASSNASQLFDQLAKEKSTDTGSKDQGGELGYFTRSKMVQEFSTAAFAQSVGSFSQEPVKTQYGYHIIYVEDHKKAVEADFNKMKDQVRTDALNQAQADKVQAYLTNLESNAQITYADAYKPAS